MSHFKYHIFICTHLKPSGKGCLSKFDAKKAVDYLKLKTKEMGISGVRGVRVTATACLGRCTKGPAMVIYPQAIWYRFDSYDDLQEIINMHLVSDKIVEHLKMPDAI